MRITFVSTGLETGGAEWMLLRLIKGLTAAGHEAIVISLTTVGRIGDALRSIDVPVHALQLSRTVPNPLGIAKLHKRLMADNPAVVQTWMYHADLLGGVSAYLGRIRPIVWGVRQSNLDPEHSPRSTRIVANICARLSYKIPDKIVCCSNAALQAHRTMGYDSSKLLVIENGFDLGLWHPSDETSCSLRTELGLANDSLIIGMAARFDAQKDHRNFFQAARILLSSYPNVHFVLCGRGINYENRHLVYLLRQSGLSENVHLLGDRDDMPVVTAAFDIATLSSRYGEGFPNVIAEAMACGVCCVATDVGDTRRIIGESGWVVPKSDPQALANAWGKAIEVGAEERRRMGVAATARVRKNFRLERCVSDFQNLYEDLVS